MELEDILRREIELNEETNKLNFSEGLKQGRVEERAKAHKEKIGMAKK
ncbi:MAG: hypothetical protein MJ211_05460 [Bacteroidales bacterium]|nr:hypothetical protein [Bacteroidales bacterium]